MYKTLFTFVLCHSSIAVLSVCIAVPHLTDFSFVLHICRLYRHDKICIYCRFSIFPRLIIQQKKRPIFKIDLSFTLAATYFPRSYPPSIIGTAELNFCVRYGYRCVLRVIATEFQLITFTYIFDISSYLLAFCFLFSLPALAFRFYLLACNIFLLLSLRIFHFLGQALGLLVSLSSIHYCTYTCDLSTT